MKPMFSTLSPIGGPDLSSTPAAILPALSSLRACRTERDAQEAIDLIPLHLIPGVVEHATRRPKMLASFTVATLCRHVGYEALVASLGATLASNLATRFAL